MRVILGTALLAAMISSSATGAPIQLTCVPTDPPRSISIRVEVDIENRWMTFGDSGFSTYDIVHFDNRYITAIERRISESYVGGEVLVLNRITGDLKRATVYLAATPEMFLDKGKTDSSKYGELVAKAFTAQCSKPLL